MNAAMVAGLRLNIPLKPVSASDFLNRMPAARNMQRVMNASLTM